MDAAAAGETTEKAQKVCPGLRDPVTFPALTLWSIKRYIGQNILAIHVLSANSTMRLVLGFEIRDRQEVSGHILAT